MGAKSNLSIGLAMQIKKVCVVVVICSKSSLDLDLKVTRYGPNRPAAEIGGEDILDL